VVVEVGRQTGRGAGDDDAVHPVRTRAERTAEAGRAELERPGEPVGEVRGIPAALDVGDDRLELGPGPVVGVLGRPRSGLIEERGHVRCRHEDTVAVPMGPSGGPQRRA